MKIETIEKEAEKFASKFLGGSGTEKWYPCKVGYINGFNEAMKIAFSGNALRIWFTLSDTPQTSREIGDKLMIHSADISPQLKQMMKRCPYIKNERKGKLWYWSI
jgi:hypothetical protein